MNLNDTLSKVVRSLRCHNEHELAAEVADALIELQQKGVTVHATPPAAPPAMNIQLHAFADLAAEIARRAPVHALIAQVQPEGREAELFTSGPTNAVLLLGLIARFQLIANRGLNNEDDRRERARQA